MKYAAIALGCLVGCGTNGVPPGPETLDAPAGVTVTKVSGAINASTMWSGEIDVTGDLTIDPAVTVTVAAGTTIKAAVGTQIKLYGTLDVQGTSTDKVTAEPSGVAWGGIQVFAGGVLTAHYLAQWGGGITVTGTGKATLIDCEMSRDAGGDFLTMNAGIVDVEYSRIGLEPGMADSTHCDMHFEGGATIKVTHSDISTAIYGLMFYGGTGADLTYNNWFSNTYDVDILQPFPVSGDFSNGWFQHAPPSGPGITATSMATARLTDAGPRS
jgi:hypothetical protein